MFMKWLSVICFLSVDASAAPSLKIIPEFHILKVSFTQQRHLADIPKPIMSKGELLLWNGKGLIWRTDTPFPNVVLITKKGLYQIEDNKKFSMRKPGQMGQEDAIFGMISKVLGGSFSELKVFTMEPLPPLNDKWRVSLKPTLASFQGFLSSIEVEGNEYISHVCITRSNGDKDDIFMENHTLFGGQDIDKALSSKEKTWFND